MRLFRDLDEAEEASFRKWARDNYRAFADIKGVWHPIVQDECRKINIEAEVDLSGWRPMEKQLSDGDAGGTFDPPTVKLTADAPTAEFTYTPKASEKEAT